MDLGSGHNAVHPGTLAYSNQKKTAWEDLMIRADHTFSLLNMAY